jgi:hypothetical protein
VGESDAAADAVAPEEPPQDARLRRLHDLLSLATVAMLIVAAVAIWRASVSEEHGSHFQATARQERLHEQQAKLASVDSVVADFRTFGDHERASLLAAGLRHDAANTTGAKQTEFLNRAEAELRVAHSLSSSGYVINVIPPTQSDGTVRSDSTYFARAIRDTLQTDPELLGAPDVATLDHKARSARRRGNDLVGIGALFVAAALLFTIGSVTGGLAPRWLGTAGLAVAVTAVVLFLAVSPPPWNGES